MMWPTAAENKESVFEKAYNGLQGWVGCFGKAELSALKHDDTMQKTYKLGNKL